MRKNVRNGDKCAYLLLLLLLPLLPLLLPPLMAVVFVHFSDSKQPVYSNE